MISETYSILFFLAAIAISMSYAYCMRKRGGYMLPLAESLITSMVIFILLVPSFGSAYYTELPFYMGVALLSAILVSLYVSRPKLFLGVMALILAGILVFSMQSPGDSIPIGMFGVGTVYGLVHRDWHSRNTVRRERGMVKSRELGRDTIQISLGAIVYVIALAYRLETAVAVIFSLIAVGYTFINMLGDRRFTGLYNSIFFKLEHRGATFGAGAIYLVAGMALLAGFLTNSPYLLFGIAALFFADSAATIVGVNVRSAKLTYNKGKSISGSIAFFIVLAVSGSILLGPWAILFAAIVAFVESLDLPIDDNLMITLTVVAIYAAIRLL